MSDVITRKVTTTANTEKHGKVQSEQTYTLDFTNATREQLVEQARKSLTIELQSKARQAAKAEGRKGLQKFDHVEIDVASYLDNKPQRKDSATKAGELLAKLSPEERAAILDEFAPTQE